MSKATKTHIENLDLDLTLCGKSTAGLALTDRDPTCGNCARVRNVKPMPTEELADHDMLDGTMFASMSIGGVEIPPMVDVELADSERRHWTRLASARLANVAAGKLTRRIARARVKALFGNRGKGLTFGEKVCIANMCAATEMPRPRMLLELNAQATKKRIAFPRRRQHSFTHATQPGTYMCGSALRRSAMGTAT